MSQAKLLIVDDDDALRATLARFLRQEGFDVVEAQDGAQVDPQSLGDVGLVLLDVNLPGESGFDVARRLRVVAPTVGVIILTGRGDLVDRVLGLELGADDYVQKPFALRELLARIRSVLRRRTGEPEAPAAEVPRNGRNNAIVFSGWNLNLISRKLTAPDGRPVELTTTEFEILRVLAQNLGETIDRQKLYEVVRGKAWSPLDRSLDNHVANLRKKMDMPGREGLIKTIHGQGYALTPE